MTTWTQLQDLARQKFRLRRDEPSELVLEVPLALPPDDAGAVWNQFVVQIAGAERDALAGHLAAHGIATEVYYPHALHLQPALAFLGHGPGTFPIAERAATGALALPLHPSLTAERIDRVIACVAGYFEKRDLRP